VSRAPNIPGYSNAELFKGKNFWFRICQGNCSLKNILKLAKKVSALFRMES